MYEYNDLPPQEVEETSAIYTATNKHKKTPLDAYQKNDEADLDLNTLLLINKASTFLLKAKCDAMKNIGMHTGDILVVDRNVKEANGRIVVAMLHGELLVRRLYKTINKIQLIPESNLAVIDVDPYVEFAVLGIVTAIIKRV
jgi:DNA polymerase V